MKVFKIKSSGTGKSLFTIDVTGDKKLDKLLDDLKQKTFKDSLIKMALRRLGKPIVTDIRKNIKTRTTTSIEKYGNKKDKKGNLRKSIGFIKGIKHKKLKPYVVVGARVYGQYEGFHAEFFEKGRELSSKLNYKGRKAFRDAVKKNGTITIKRVRDEMIKILERRKKIKGL
jgi:hypothetical protein